MYGTGTASSKPAERKRGNQKLAKLFAAVSDDEDDDPSSPAPTSTPVSTAEEIEHASKPWLREFKLYLESIDEIPEGMSKITWWGVSQYFCCSLFDSFLSSVCLDQFSTYSSLGLACP